jgi:hypothetical protein
LSGISQRVPLGMRLILLLILSASCLAQSRLAKVAKVVSIISGTIGAANVSENAYAVSTGRYIEQNPLVASRNGSPSVWKLSLAQGALFAGTYFMAHRKWEVRSADGRAIELAPMLSIVTATSVAIPTTIATVHDIRTLTR